MYPFWLSKTYKKELLKDALKLFPKRNGLRILKEYFINRIYDRHISKYETIFQEFKKQNVKTIFEIGSYDGYDSLIMSRIFPTAKVFAFEADPDNVKKVKRNIHFRRNIQLIEKAVTDHTGNVTFHQTFGKMNKDDFRGSGSILEPTEKLNKYWKNIEIGKTISVDAISLKDFAEDKKIKELDIIWMDVQGAELLVLEGMEQLILRTKLVLLEIWEDEALYKNCINFNALKSFFEENNFQLSHYWRDGISGDAIFTNKKFF